MWKSFVEHGCDWGAETLECAVEAEELPSMQSYVFGELFSARVTVDEELGRIGEVELLCSYDYKWIFEYLSKEQT